MVSVPLRKPRTRTPGDPLDGRAEVALAGVLEEQTASRVSR